MPRGSEHILTGMLLKQRGRPILEVDGGGTWRLVANMRLQKHLGQRVTLRGTRIDFDVLDVDAITAAGKPLPDRQGFIASWQFATGVASALVALGLLVSMVGCVLE